MEGGREQEGIREVTGNTQEKAMKVGDGLGGTGLDTQLEDLVRRPAPVIPSPSPGWGWGGG